MTFRITGLDFPRVLCQRMISLRAFDDKGMIALAELCCGELVEDWIEASFKHSHVSSIHLHDAKHGGFACRADRADSGTQATMTDA